jgi:hypothetical protein
MKLLTPDVVPMDAHIGCNGLIVWPAGQADQRSNSVLPGAASGLLKVPAAPLPGAPHTMPSQPLQTTASCRRSMQYTTS